MNEKPLKNGENKISASYYNGDFLSNLFFTVISYLCRILSLDIAAPIVNCIRLRWRAEHTYLNGRRMIFTGKIKDLFLKNLLWVFLSIITIGVFIPFKMIKMAKWEAEHFHFVGVPESNYNVEKSAFNCKWYSYFGIQAAYYLGSILTLGIAHYMLYIFKERKIISKTTIDGHKLEFNGKASAYFKKRVLWLALYLITLGTYVLHLKGKFLRWKISNTVVQSPQTLPYSDEVAAMQPIHPVNRKCYFCFFLMFPIIALLVCAWSSKVLCRHGIYNPVSIVPFVINFTAAALILFGLSLAAKAYLFSLSAKSGKHFPIGLIAVCSLLLAVNFALFVLLVFLLF